MFRIINLETDTEKLDNISSQLHQYDIKYKISKAIDGRHMNYQMMI